DLLGARGEDDRNEGPVRLRRVIAEAGAATNVANHEQRQEQGVPGGDEPHHSSFSPSTAATTAAAVRCPVTFVIVRNMSGMRSSPMSSVSPESGSAVDAKAGVRLTMLP